MTAAKALRWGALRSLATAFRTATRPGTPGVATRLSALPRLVWATFRGEYAGTSRARLLAIVGATLLEKGRAVVRAGIESFREMTEGWE